jgi:hypothetical protein
MSTSVANGTDPGQVRAADDAVRRVLETQWAGEPAVRLDSPPGAGKTGVVERLAVQSLGLLHERSMVVTQTNEQGFDLARRLSGGFPRHRFYLLKRDDLMVPTDLERRTNLAVVHRFDELPQGPCVIIANASKWSWIQDHTCSFDLQIVDEAFQLPDFRFQQIAGLARRIVLVGDPGQIAPVISSEIERWKCDPAGPHIPCPLALVQRQPGVRKLSLPVSRRLVQDTVNFVQPAFYPNLPFSSFTANGGRTLKVARSIAGRKPMDRAFDEAESGASLAFVELAAGITGELDEELAATIVAMVERLMERSARIHEGGSSRAVTASMIGVACAHVSQVNAVRERLPQGLSDVFVETADRFQGLEREIIFIHHPLSGRADASEFHLDAGRLCVMLSRHRTACWILGRSGIQRQLLRYAPSGDRVLGVADDPEYRGWRSHMLMFESLQARNRIFSLVP